MDSSASRRGSALSSRSKPFCELKREMIPKTGDVRIRRQSHFALQFALADLLAVRVLGGKVRRDQVIRLRIPDMVVDAVEDAVEDIFTVGEHPLQPFAELRRLDFFRIGRADGAQVSA